MITANDILRYAAANGGLREARFTVSLKRTETADGSTARGVLTTAPASLDEDEVISTAAHGLTVGLGKGAVGGRNIQLSGAAAMAVAQSIITRTNGMLATDDKDDVVIPERTRRRGRSVVTAEQNGTAE